MLLYDSNIMKFNIQEEKENVVLILNDALSKKKFFRNYEEYTISTRVNFILNVLKMTNEYPEIETYLKDLFVRINNSGKKYIRKINRILNIIFDFVEFNTISLNSFEILINAGANVNDNSHDHPTIHYLCINYMSFCYRYDKTCDIVIDILNLLIKYGCDLNILDKNKRTALDILTESKIFDDRIKVFITWFLDNSAKNIEPIMQNNDICDFIESYHCANIKCATK